jgi:hypothetical protein
LKELEIAHLPFPSIMMAMFLAFFERDLFNILAIMAI